MANEVRGDDTPLNQAREVTIEALMEHFANDVMEVEEFERRVELAHAATDAEDLKDLLRDMPGGGDLPVPTDASGRSVPASRSSGSYSVAPSASVQEREFVVAVMGGSSRRGHWRPARKNYAVAIMGGAEIDLREAVLGPGVTEIQIYTMWGGVEVIVPPGLNVESHGVAVMGGFEHIGDTEPSIDYDAPTVRITGVALMAGVEISVRHPGETPRDARRRRKFEKREKRKRLRGE